MNIKLKVSNLKAMSIIYLAFPFFIFFLGWLKLPIGILLSVILFIGVYKTIIEKTKQNYIQIPVLQFVSIIILVSLWVLFSGAGGFGYQNHDYYKHNSLMKDLAIEHWPVSYKLAEGQKFLSHYLAYYLPGPSLFYQMGWKWINLANFIFTFSGVLLAIFWILKFVGKYSFWVIAIFIFGSGAHLFVIIYTHGFEVFDFLTNNIKTHGHLFWLNCLSINKEPINTLNFMTVTDMLYWGPQHAISCWLAIGMLLNDWMDKNIKYSPFYISLIAFWAPLVLVGLAPFLLYAIVNQRFKEVFNWVNLVIAPIIFMVIAIFLTSIKTNELIHHFIFHDRSEKGISTFSQILAYIYFLIVEVFIWWLPSYLVLQKTVMKKFNSIFWLALVLLCVIPLFRYGQWNDWCTRASLPSLYIIYCMVAMAIFYGKSKKIKLALIAICLLCSVSPISLILASLNHNGFKIKWSPPKVEFISDLPTASVGFPVDQFVADPDCFFYKYLAKNK
jgi:hypothetical protein